MSVENSITSPGAFGGGKGGHLPAVIHGMWLSGRVIITYTRCVMMMMMSLLMAGNNTSQKEEEEEKEQKRNWWRYF